MTTRRQPTRSDAEGTSASFTTPEASPRRSRTRWARAGRWFLTLVVGVLGAAIAVTLVPPATADLGPVTASIRLRPSVHPSTVILLPPAGQVSFDTHAAPVRIEARVESVDITRASALISSDRALKDLERTAPDAITSAATRNALLTALAAGLGAGIAVGITFRAPRRAVVAGVSAIALAAGGAGLTGATFRSAALSEPHFDGLVSQAAALADISQATAADYANYRKNLADFVGQVSALYIAADSLPAGRLDHKNLITVLHVSDIHDNPQAFDVIKQLTQQFHVSFVIDTGDFVSWGTSWEEKLATQVGSLSTPYVFITGNHDGSKVAARIAAQKNAIVLNNEVRPIGGITIAGIGDPRFAADDSSDTAEGKAKGSAAVQASGIQLGDTIDAWNAKHPASKADVALIHDPTQPLGLEGRVPLVLSGHMHKNNVQLDRDSSGTDWMTVGSTGGALGSGGVRPVADGGKPLDLSARLLYFDKTTKRLVAYDDVTMGGLGLVSVSIERHQIPPRKEKLTPVEVAPTDRPSGPAAPSGSPIPDRDRVTTSPSPSRPASDSGAG